MMDGSAWKNDSVGDAIPVSGRETQSIDYSDASEERVLAFLRGATDLRSHSRIAAEHYDDWAVRYHLCPERSVLLRPFCLQGLKVLELGAGMGGVSRFLAEECAHLTVVEGTEARGAALRERLRDLDNWDCHIANIQHFETTQRYDVVCLIGVLEYAQLFIGGKTPFETLLSKAASFLSEDGVLIVAIENRLGVKYWNGAAEDHTNRLFDGLVGYPPGVSPRTFSRQELVGLLGRAGFPEVREFFPFPDYKTPHAILSDDFIDIDATICAGIASLQPLKIIDDKRAVLMPPNLLAESIASAGLLKEFSNSFLFVGGRTAGSPVRDRLLRRLGNDEIGWHFNIGGRILPTITIFRGRRDGTQSVEVSKCGLLDPGVTSMSFSSAATTVRWNSVDPAPLAVEDKLIQCLGRSIYHGDWAKFEMQLEDFILWSFEHWATESAHFLKPQALDANAHNAACRREGSYTLFDQEWALVEDMPKSWFIFRNIIAIRNLYVPGDAVSPYASLRELYERLCNRLGVVSDFTGDMHREDSFLRAVWKDDVVYDHFAVMDYIFSRPLPRTDAPRSAAEMAGRAARIGTLEAELQTLRAVNHDLVTSRSFRLALKLARLGAAFPLFRRLFSRR